MQAKGWVEGATDSVVGNAKNLYGKVVGDKETEVSICLSTSLDCSSRAAVLQ